MINCPLADQNTHVMGLSVSNKAAKGTLAAVDRMAGYKALLMWSMEQMRG